MAWPARPPAPRLLACPALPGGMRLLRDICEMEISPIRNEDGGEPVSRLLSAWWKLSQALKRRVAPRLENEYGVRFKHFLVLTNISRGHRSPGALAETLGFPPSEVSRVLDVLSRKGLVRREVDPEDLRRMKLELTPAGDAVLAGMNGSMSKLFQRDVAGCVPRSRLERLAAALDIACELSEDP